MTAYTYLGPSLVGLLFYLLHDTIIIPMLVSCSYWVFTFIHFTLDAQREA